MFTGLVQATGMLGAVNGGRLSVELQPPLGELAEGESIAVNGVCLTATEIDDRGGFEAELTPETLRRTTLGGLSEGDWVNLELPLRASDRLGGHIVQGHVDGTVKILDVEEERNARVLRIEAGPELLRYVVEKGSIAVDGVSLTVASVDDSGFTVSLVPETLERTTLGSLEPGASVNLEVDLVAKYVEKLVAR